MKNNDYSEKNTIIVGCSDPRLGGLFCNISSHFVARHAGGYLEKPGVNYSMDDSILIARKIGYKNIVIIAHTDCVALITAHETGSPMHGDVMEEAWGRLSKDKNLSDNNPENSTLAAAEGVKISMENAILHGFKDDEIFGGVLNTFTGKITFINDDYPKYLQSVIEATEDCSCN